MQICEEYNSRPEPTWRLREKMRTSGAALCVCLNVGTDPPDVVKPTPSARKECWFDPFTTSKIKALEIIGNNLLQQYERLQSKAKYKQCLDPTSEDLRRVCMTLRKGVKSDRLLFHYNGHGVPRPTENGEIWVFGKHYTHYMPVGVSELRLWLGDPCIYVFDCSSAGMLMRPLIDPNSNYGNDDSHDMFSSGVQSPSGTSVESDESSAENKGVIVLAACAAGEILPTSAQYPADVFTACLTTPIQMAIHWFILQNPYSMAGIPVNIADSIPGKDNDRKTPRGELVWMFTAITDTIAWDTLSSSKFQRLFRQDLLVASLFRNFLLAKRMMKSMGCTAQCYPHLPDTSNHTLWQSWDLALEGCIKQLYKLQNGTMMIDSKNNLASPFFTMHLTAFDVWLELGGRQNETPMHLPIILQVLLSQSHRARALNLIQKYLTISPGAVNLSLLVGIFPYLVKLLQSPTAEIKQVMISIWCNIIGFDVSCRMEIVRDPKLANYFVQYLTSRDAGVTPLQRCMAAFILTELCDGCREGRDICLESGLHRACIRLLKSATSVSATNSNSAPTGSAATPSAPNPTFPQRFPSSSSNSAMNSDSHNSDASDGTYDMGGNGSEKEETNAYMVRQWVALCLGKLCQNNPTGKHACIQEGAQDVLLALLNDPNVLVRASAMFALGELFGSPAVSACPPPPPQPMMSPSNSYSNFNAANGTHSPQRIIYPKSIHPGPGGIGGAPYPNAANFGPSMNPPQPMGPSDMHPGGMGVGVAAVPGGLAPGDSPGSLNSNELPFDLKQFELNLVVKILERSRDAAVVVRKEAIIAISKFIRIAPHVHCISLLVLSLEEMRQAADGAEDGESDAVGSSHSVGSLIPPSGNRSRSNSTRDHATHVVSADDSQRLIEKLKAFISESPMFTDTIGSMTANENVRGSVSRGNSVSTTNSINSGGSFNGPGFSYDSDASASGVNSSDRGRSGSATKNTSKLPTVRSFTDPSWNIASIYVRLWMSLREMQNKEPHSIVCQALSTMSQVIVAKSRSDQIVRQNKLNSYSSNGNLSSGSVSPTRPSNLTNGTSQAQGAFGGGNSGASPFTATRSSESVGEWASPPRAATKGGMKSIPEDVGRDSVATPTRLSANPSSSSISEQGNFSPGSIEAAAAASKQLSDKYLALFESLPALKSHFYPWCKVLFMRTQLSSANPAQGGANYIDPLSREGSDAYYKSAKRAEMLATFRSIGENCKSLVVDARPNEEGSVSGSGGARGSTMNTSPLERDSVMRESGMGGRPSSMRDSSAIAITSTGSSAIKFEQKAILNTENTEMTSMVLFHAYQDVLAISDGTGVDIWALDNGSKIMHIKNTPNLGASASSTTSRVTSMQWLNEATDALLCIGSDDGAVKVWRDSGSEHTTTVTSSGGATLAAAFVALPDVIEIQRGSGLVSSWDQSAGNLLVGGNSPTIRLWDLAREQCVRAFQTGKFYCAVAVTVMYFVFVYMCL